MSRMSGDARKRAIVRAALPLFARKGFAETTTKELAKAAGVSEPLLYKHFPSKEALYLEIQNYCCQALDPTVQKLNEMPPGTEALVHLVYYLLRAMILGKPSGAVDWKTRHRLMIQSLLDDGGFARVIFRNRLEPFCERIEACLKAANRSGHLVKSPVKGSSGAYFAHHMGGWIALARLPRRGVVDYRGSLEELLEQAVWFALRGMGLRDEALIAFYKPKQLQQFFGRN